MKRIIVKGRSMEPTLYEGETYLVRRAKWRELKVDDIVVAEIDGKLVVKRIVKKSLCFCDLEGDNRGHSHNFLGCLRSEIKYKLVRPTILTLLIRWRRCRK